MYDQVMVQQNKSHDFARMKCLTEWIQLSIFSTLILYCRTVKWCLGHKIPSHL